MSAEGGLGGGSAPTIKDTRLIARAVRERWPIPSSLRKPLIEKLMKTALDPGSSRRESTTAARALLVASRINVEAATLELRVREYEDRSKPDEEPQTQIDLSQFSTEDKRLLMRWEYNELLSEAEFARLAKLLQQIQAAERGLPVGCSTPEDRHRTQSARSSGGATRAIE